MASFPIGLKQGELKDIWNKTTHSAPESAPNFNAGTLYIGYDTDGRAMLFFDYNNTRYRFTADVNWADIQNIPDSTLLSSISLTEPDTNGLTKILPIDRAGAEKAALDLAFLPYDYTNKTVTKDVTFSGSSKVVFTNGIEIKGAVDTKPLLVSNIVGTNGTNTTAADLYLQYGANKAIKLGKEGKYTISADGSTYSGTAEKANKDNSSNTIDTTYFASAKLNTTNKHIIDWVGGTGADLTGKSLTLPMVLTSGDTMTGTLIFNDCDGIFVKSKNHDVAIWNVKDFDAGTHGFKLVYKGTGEGNTNSLILYADNQAAETPIAAMTMTQDGKMVVSQHVTASGGITGNLTGTADQAIKDSAGNNIAATYFASVALDSTNKHKINFSNGNGAAISSVTMPYVLSTGDTMTGNLSIQGTNPYVCFKDSSGTAQGYVQFIASDKTYAFGAGVAKSLVVTENGSLSIPGSQTITSRTNNTGSVGTDTLKWSAMYANTFYGNLSGNASTATKANLLNLSHGSVHGGSSTETSTWNGQRSELAFVWGQRWMNSSATGNSDSGDLVLGLRPGIYSPNSTELCMCIDGDYYSMGNVVLHAGNYHAYSSFSGTVKSTYAGPAFLAETAAGAWSYLRMSSGGTLWDIATRSDLLGGSLQFRVQGADTCCYIDRSANFISYGYIGVGNNKVRMSYNTSKECLDFTFA